eukprot:1914380-Pyramimonas_sp.AAC.1
MSSRITVDKCSKVAPPMHSARLRHGINKSTIPTFDTLARWSLSWTVELVDAVARMLLVLGGRGSLLGMHNP